MALENIGEYWAHSGIMIFCRGSAQKEYLVGFGDTVLSTRDDPIINGLCTKSWCPVVLKTIINA